jgi:hypothetical protein
VLAHGQTLRHEFELRNPSGKPLRILGAEALTPCCSSIDKLPDTVPANGSIKVLVTFKPGYRGGHRQVRFLVTTDDHAHPTRAFSLSASIAPEVEVNALDGSASVLLLGQAGTQTLRVTCRRAKEEGRGAPESVEASPGLSAHFIGSAVEETDSEGWITATRDVVVELPQGSDAGPKQGTLILKWPEGLTHEQPVSWRVRPSIEAAPAALVLNGSDRTKPQSVLLRAADVPFRILDIDGARLDKPDGSLGEAVKSHVLHLSLSDEGWPDATTREVVITTDHPHQPKVIITVLLLTGAKGGQ